MADVDGIEPMNYHQRITLPYRYTAGAANTDFLRSLARGRILGSRCERCHIVMVPARPFCPSCFQSTGERVPVADTGEVVSHTTGPDGSTVALIRLDGTDTHFPHVVEGVGVESGTRVRARFGSDPAPEITAIEGFEAV